MDQAIKSALNKYNGKKDTTVRAEHSQSNFLLIISVIVLIVICFSVCVKSRLFGADVLWQRITSVSVNVNEIKEKIRDIFVKDTEETSTSPVNETGESGEILAAETISRTFSAQYLNNISNKFKFVQPVSGIISCGYGQRVNPVTGKEGFHSGIDIAAELGTDVVSFKGGTVIQIGNNKTYGNFVLIDHNNCQTFYGHLSEIFVTENQSVSLGQTIGTVGSTGQSTGPHLHFEIRNGTQTYDPAKSVYA